MITNSVTNTQLGGATPATDDPLNDFYGYVDDLVGTFENNDNGLAFYSEDPNHPTLDPNHPGDADSQLMIFNLKNLLTTGPSGAATSDFMTALNFAMNQTTNPGAQTLAKNLNTILTTPYQFLSVSIPAGAPDPTIFQGKNESLLDMCKTDWVGGGTYQQQADWEYMQQMIGDTSTDSPIIQIQNLVGSIAKSDHPFVANAAEEKLMGAIAKFNTYVQKGNWVTAASCVISLIIPDLKALPANDPIAQEVIQNFCVNDTYGNNIGDGSAVFNRWRNTIQGDSKVYSGVNSIQEIAQLVVNNPTDATLAANFGHLLTNDDGNNSLRGAGAIGTSNFGSWAGMFNQMVTFYGDEGIPT